MPLMVEATFITFKEELIEVAPRARTDEILAVRQVSEEEANCQKYTEQLLQRAAQLRSAGSQGHPELCRKPCLFRSGLGKCPSGVQCNFCHLLHGASVKFDKRLRCLLKEMGEAERMALVLPHLRAKANAMRAMQ
ncbi:unnamed protein product, partial [Effrenium voratum]